MIRSYFHPVNIPIYTMDGQDQIVTGASMDRLRFVAKKLL